MPEFGFTAMRTSASVARSSGCGASPAVARIVPFPYPGHRSHVAAPSPVNRAGGRVGRRDPVRHVSRRVPVCLKSHIEGRGRGAPPRGLDLGDPGLADGSQGEASEGRVGSVSARAHAAARIVTRRVSTSAFGSASAAMRRSNLRKAAAVSPLIARASGPLRRLRSAPGRCEDRLPCCNRTRAGGHRAHRISRCTRH